MNDTEQISALFFLIAQIGKKDFQLHSQSLCKQEESVNAGCIGAGFEAANGFRVKTGFLT